LHRYADRIKARALRRTGEIAKQIEPKQGGDRRSKGHCRPIDSRKSAANGAGICFKAVFLGRSAQHSPEKLRFNINRQLLARSVNTP